LIFVSTVKLSFRSGTLYDDDLPLKAISGGKNIVTDVRK
jgi:hypothetical protein